MIATCPACGKRYRLADAAVRPEGRGVRCAACGHGWTAVPDPASQLAFDDPEPDPPAPVPPRRWRVPAALAAAIAAAAAGLTFFAPVLPPLALPAIPAIDLPPLDLTRVPVVGNDLDRLVFPPPSPPSPLRITVASAERRILRNGTRLLVVTGSVANPTIAPLALTAIDAELAGPGGGVRLRWRIAAPVAVLPPGHRAGFESVAANPPAGATTLRLRPAPR